MQSSGLEPRWSSPPGDTIASVMRDRGITITDLTVLLGMSRQEISNLLDGSLSITVSVARSLARTLGGSTEFWIARDAQYLDDRARLEADQWAGRLPVKQMVEFNWIEGPANWHERIENCLAFFSVEDVSSFEKRYGQVVYASHYRTSPTYSIDNLAAAAWFRAGEVASDRIESVATYMPTDFQRSLSRIRTLSRVKQPDQFIPKLVQICASCGVHVTVVRAPDAFPASGAARLYRGRPLIQLSARYLSDDHLWFTFFHEAAHVLLHSLDEPFVDIDDLRSSEDKLELEANEHAMMTLLNGHRFRNRPYSHREVMEIALELDVSPGIIVGQLQHAGYVPRTHLNRLKRRYIWQGPNLEMAQRN